MATAGNDELATRTYGESSDADSDLEELEGDIARLNQSVEEFLSSHRGDGVSRQTGHGRRGGVRGPRKAAKPRGDITARLSRINQAFMNGDYDQALDLAFEVIRINAETHQAWITVASIFREQGDLEKALSAMIYAANLRPKDVNGWLHCASFALSTITETVDDTDILKKARVCYSAALRADRFNIEARLGKASICHRQGHFSAAIHEYKTVLKRCPFDLEVVRRLAEACVDNKYSESYIPDAINAYREYFEHVKLNFTGQPGEAPWQDIGIYIDLFAASRRYSDALRELKRLSRWFVGRGGETYWDSWKDDDREWDADDERRSLVVHFVTHGMGSSLYGQSLPHDLRARMAIYRSRLENEDEALRHLLWLDPTSSSTREFAADFPDLVFDLAEALASHVQTKLAIAYYEILSDLPGDTDANVFLQLGRCYAAEGDNAKAEECFLAAIDADEDNIEARVELANMYEKAREDEEALILAAEAMALREVQGHSQDSEQPPILHSAHGERAARRVVRRHEGTPQLEGRKPRVPTSRRLLPRRYRPRRFAGPDKQQEDERARALKLTKQYEIVRDLRQQIKGGRPDLIPEWMASSKELIDDFRSLKKFYTWEKYLHFLGRKGPKDGGDSEEPQTELLKMYERLARTLAQFGSENPNRAANLESHQGISFDKWLDLFLDYAIGLAIEHRREEAYQVCEAARDSTAFQAPQQMFMIYVAWSVCAVYASDEERCVITARQLMRDGAMSDSWRMFALLASLCQSPASWYTSGPAQKFILRQIKAIDDAHEARGVYDGKHNPDPLSKDLTLDACLLMLYGHILFTSTSYTFALSYFLRARALDPDNSMVNLSLGLAYVHYGLKRQATNRQYLLLQGQAFLTRYAELSSSGDEETGARPIAEAYYNIGRLYQLLGINYLAYEYYSRAKEAIRAQQDNPAIRSITLNNELMSLLNIRNNQQALRLLKESIRL